MGLEDTSPLTTENEGLDSGLGEAPPTSDKKVHSPTDTVEAEISEVVEKTSVDKTRARLQASVIPGGTKQEPLRKSSRKKGKRDLDPDKILDQKQKKSLEKVAEWLMNVPTEGTLELEQLNEDADDSDSCSSSSTTDCRQHSSDVNPTRENRAKALEDQVFGAVYRRRGNRAIFSPHNAKETAPEAGHTAEVVVKPTLNESNASDMEEEQQVLEEEKEISSDIHEDEPNEVMEENYGDKYGEELTDLPENAKNENKDEVPCPVSAPEQQQPKRESRKRTSTTLQEVDSDFMEQAKATSGNTEQKKTDRRRSKNIRSARVTKPLLLVAVQNEESSLKPTLRSEEVQVHIENYPSSEDQEVPVTRSMRRSRRLKVFTEEVQGGRRKVNPKAKIPEKDNGVAKQSENAERGTVEDTASPKCKNQTNRPERNGCIYNQDLGVVENMECGEGATCLTPDHFKSEALSEAAAACLGPVVPSSKSPTEAGVVEPTLFGNNPTKRSSSSNRLETSACSSHFTGIENDSEQDTEQLVKSFRTTKRKSFHLGGGPPMKRSCIPHQENDPRAAAKEENQSVCSGAESAIKQIGTKIPDITNHKAVGDSENLSCSDIIPPSNSPGLAKKAADETDQVVVEDCVLRSNDSSPLAPNQRSKRETESPCFSSVPKVGDSGLCFSAVEHDELCVVSEQENPTHRTTREEIPNSMSAHTSSGKHSANEAEPILNAESSLTPDGLGIPLGQTVHEAKSSGRCSGALSSHSSIRRTRRKRTRAQRLESSSDSSNCTGEELPTLTEIFTKSAPPPAVAQDPGLSSEANRCEAAAAAGAQPLSPPPPCPSPDCVNSSQASVDLFGTPEECEFISS